MREREIGRVFGRDHLVVRAEDKGFDFICELLGKFVKKHDEAALWALWKCAWLDDVTEFTSVETHPARI